MASRDDGSFGEFVAARSAALHRTAYLLVRDPQLSQDLVQEALTKTYVAWPRLRDVAKAEPYTRRVITTTAITWFRRRSWRERPVDRIPDTGSPSEVDEVDARVLLWRAIGDLPARQRAAIVLRFFEDLTEAQTANTMGCAVGTVKSQVSAGLAKLRSALGTDATLLDPIGAS